MIAEVAGTPTSGRALLPLLAGLLMVLSILLSAPVGSSAPAAVGSLPHAAVVLPPTHSASAPISPGRSAPFVSSFNPPHLTTAIRNAPSLIYTYKNQQELYPQDSQVSLFVNATGNGVPNYANVQVVFVVETTLYDGVYDPTVSDPGYNNPCNGPCDESNAVPYFIANSGRLAADIASNNPYSQVSFAMVDYFATLGTHDDGDGAEYHVDVGTFTPAGSFQSAVVNGFQNPVLGGAWYYGDSDYSDNIGDSSSITALYGALKGSNLAWNPADHHVIVWVGSTAPRDPNYAFNYAGTHSDYNSGMSTTCEPSYNYGGGLTSPNCEQWTTGSNNLASLAKSLGVTIDTIDVASGMTIASSQDYTSSSYGTADSNAINSAGCNLASATGGSWEGPSGVSCSVASTGTGTGNLTCASGSSCFQGQSGTTYSNPPRTWGTNSALGWAIDHISFGPVSVSNVTASSNGQPMFQFTPELNITADPYNPAWSVSCLRNGAPLSGCQQTPTTTSVGAATVYGWGWPASTMDLNDTWTATFNVVATGSPYNVSYPLDACTASGCTGPVGGAGAYSLVDYKNYQGTPTSLSFPPSNIYVVYPGMSVFVSPPYARGLSGFTQLFSVTVGGGQPPYTYQWYVNSVAQSGATGPSFLGTFSSTGTYIVRCLVWDAYGKQASGTSQVTILASSSNLFSLQGTLTNSKTLQGIPGATVGLNGTWGSTLSGSTGGYTLGPIVNGTYTLYVNASGYRPYAGPVTVKGNTWDNLSLTPVPPKSYTVTGYVTSYATGAALPGADVVLSYFGTTMANVTSNAQGAFVLSGILNASYTLSATLSGYNPASLSVVVQGANVTQNISLTTLPPSAYYITGTVTNNATGAAISGALVTLNNSALSNTTNANGVYLLTPVYAGVYTVSVSATGYSSQSKATTVASGPMTVSFQLSPPPPPPTPTFTLQGTVLDQKTLLPVSGATVIVTDSTGKLIATVHASVSGDYAVTGLVNGTYNAKVGAPNYLNASVGFSIVGMSHAQNFYLTPLAGGKVTTYTVQGVLVNCLTGQGVTGATITVVPTLGTTTSGSSGAFGYTQAANGTYSLSASATGHRTAYQNFTVSGSNVQLTVEMDCVTLYQVSGLVEDASSGTGIQYATVTVLNATTPPIPPNTTQSGGSFHFSSPSGHLELKVAAGGYQSAFDNITVRNVALSGVLIYLKPVIPGGSTSPGNTNGWLKPGPYGLYLQVWAPLAGGLATFAIGFLFLKRRHQAAARLGKGPGASPTDPEGATVAQVEGRPPSPPPPQG
ncbi:MAG: carboxypeptidase regulatory-like domain-containing protein [Euryarchaeota archaeon]|nr:carboxypeptidase regulatory-like domain-containing protein [Euryarchaeota archaeon]